MPKIQKSIIENFLESLISEKGLSENTIESYKNDIMQFLEKYSTNQKKDQLYTRESVERYISSMNNLGFERSTVLRKISSFSIRKCIAREPVSTNYSTQKKF